VDQVSAAAPSSSQGFFEQNYFLLRRLHSLTGIVPIGVFLIAHLVTNSSVAWGKFGLRGEHGELGLAQGGAAYFHKEVVWINTQVPHLFLIEVTLWAAIAFHSILGVVFALSGKSNVSRYAYQSNWRYLWQRISGYVGILFIFYHVATLRWGWTFLVPGGTQWDHNYAASTLAMCLRGHASEMTAAGILVSLGYFIGVSLLVFHFANGLWTAAITWGVTITQQAQKQWGYVCFALGAALMLAGWASIAGFALMDPMATRNVERQYFVEDGKPVPTPKGMNLGK
jgi:succinate dehydrogenase / fumarate reductase cytochrome b subunit